MSCPLLVRVCEKSPARCSVCGDRANHVVGREAVRSLDVHEEEHPVLHDRPAQREPVLIDVLFSLRDAVALVRPAVGVEPVAAQIGVTAAVQRVRAGPRRGRDDTAAGAAEFGGEPIRHDLEFLHALERRRVIQIVRRAVALLGAVEKHCRRVRARAVDEWPRACVSAIHHTWGERDERIWIATHDRQLDHLPPRNHVPERRTLQLQVSDVSTDGDLRLHRRDFEREIDRGGQADANVHVRHARAGESGKRRGDVVCADGQVRDGIDARPVCHRLADDAGTRLCDNHCGAGDDASRFVEHPAR